MSDFQAKFNRSKASDIGEHLETLKEYASRVDSIIEFGTRTGCSTAAWLMGGAKKITCYDINDCLCHIGEHVGFAGEKGIDFQFIVGDSLEVESEPCDLLFIDTVHVYDQLTAELNRHGSDAGKYIICHDTVYDAGCLRAIEDYIGRNPEWKIKEHFENNNGLTVLERIGPISELQAQLQAWFDERMGPQAVVIEEHFETLLKYGNMVERITEFGVHAGASTCCWLMTKPKSYIGYDIDYGPLELRSVYEAYAKENGTDFTLFCQSSTEEHIEETDLLFIDSDHSSTHLTAELEMQNDKVKRFIILHDTECKACPDLKGVVDKFVEGSVDWEIREHFTNNCGLTILERINSETCQEKEGVSMETQKRTGIVIHSAIYGVGLDREKDVTGVVAGLVADGATSVVACNDILGDPALGMVKRLNVKFSVDGVAHNETVGENRMITFVEGKPDDDAADSTESKTEPAGVMAGETPPEPAPESVNGTIREDLKEPEPVDLSDISYSELKTMCKEAGLPANGSKVELIERLTAPVEPTE